MASITEDLIRRLDLTPHPEGGFYREVHRSTDTVQHSGNDRAALTSIYFLLAKGQHSRWHVVDADEAWHFYDGDPLELLDYDPVEESLVRTLLGPVGVPGAQPLYVVPRGHWQAATPLGSHALAGCTVAPGFEFSDFRFVADVGGYDDAFARDLAAYGHLI